MESTVIQRIEKIMDFYSISQRKFSERVGAPQSTVSSLLNRGSDPGLGFMQNILEAFPDLNPYWLLMGEGKMIRSGINVTTERDIDEAPGLTERRLFLETEHGIKYYELSNGKFIMNVPFISTDRKKKFVAAVAEGKEINLDEWETMDFVVNRIGMGTYFSFEIWNDGMMDGTANSIKIGDVLLGRQLDPIYWKAKLNYRDYPSWIIVSKTEIFCKQIIDHDMEKKTITLHSPSPSPEYSDFTLKLSEVKQLYNVITRISTVL